MPFTPMASTVLTVWTGHRGLDLRNMVTCYKYNGLAPSAAELQSLNTELIANVLPKLRDISCSDLTWESITSRWMGSPNGVEVTTPILANGQGTRAQSSSPGNVAYAVSWRTGNSGRSFRGRNYLTNLGEDDTTGDGIVGALVSLIIDFATSFLVTRVLGKFAPAVGSRKLGISTPYISYVLEPTLDSMRRRLANRGR